MSEQHVWKGVLRQAIGYHDALSFQREEVHVMKTPKAVTPGTARMPKSISADEITVQREIVSVQPPGPVRNDWPTVDGPAPKCDGND